MQSRMKGVLTMTSTAGARPLPSARGIRRCEMTALSTLASCRRTCFCWCGANTDDDAVDRFGGVDGVQRGEHEVAGFGGEQAGLDRFEVAHFADENHVGILPQRAAQRVGERLGVDRHLALVDDRLRVAVEELDRILDRHHVRLARVVDVVDHRRQRRALAAAGRARDQHEAALFLGDGLEHLRQAQLVDRADLHRDDAKHQPDRAALLEHVAAEAAEPGHAVGEVDFLRVLEFLALLRRHDRRAHRDDVFVVELLVAG